VNQRKDLYPDDQSLCRAYAKVLADELREVIAAGCDYIQFDETDCGRSRRKTVSWPRGFSMS